MPPDLRALEPAAGERPRAPVSADSTGAAIAADRPLDPTPAPGTAAAARAARARRRPGQGRDRRGDRVRRRGARPAARPPPATPASSASSAGSGRATRSAGSTPTSPPRACGSTTPSPTTPRPSSSPFPTGPSAARIDEFLDAGQTVIDLGPDFRLRDPADYPRWYHFDHPRPELLETAVYGLPELHRDELAAAGRSARARSSARPAATRRPRSSPWRRWPAPGSSATSSSTPRAGVSGAGRDPKPDLQFGEVNESVKAYGIFTHRHIGEIEQELGALGGGLSANPGVTGVDFLPHLIPMTRGILSAGHVRTTRAVTQAELDDLYHDAYGDEPFVTVVRGRARDEARARHNEARVWCRARRAQRPRARHRRARQPRQGRRRARRSRRSTSSTACPRRPALLQLPLAP